jgi:hypothetical protein
MNHPATRTLAGLGVTGLVAGIALGLARSAGLGLAPALPVAVFLAGFGVLKLGLALDAVVGVRLQVVPDPRTGQSNPTTFALWVAFRFLVATVALAAAAGLLLWPEAAARLV